MKNTLRKLLPLFLVLALLCLPVLASCGTTGTTAETTTEADDAVTAEAITTEALTTAADAETEATTAADADADEPETTADPFTVTFSLDEHVTVTVYAKQSDMESGENGTENATVAYARDGDSGEILSDGNGQVNFTVAVDEGYIIDDITATEGTYKNVKDPKDTAVENGYRVTKITSDTTVTVTTKVKPADPFTVTFVTDANVSITVYNTQALTDGAENATVAYARDGDSGEILVDGNGQVNFVLVFADGYELDGMEIEGTYKNNKSIAENTYRVTKIESNLTVTITAKASA